jgi:hypothetical protein
MSGMVFSVENPDPAFAAYSFPATGRNEIYSLSFESLQEILVFSGVEDFAGCNPDMHFPASILS